MTKVKKVVQVLLVAGILLAVTAPAVEAWSAWQHVTRADHGSALLHGDWRHRIADSFWTGMLHRTVYSETRGRVQGGTSAVGVAIVESGNGRVERSASPNHVAQARVRATISGNISGWNLRR